MKKIIKLLLCVSLIVALFSVSATESVSNESLVSKKIDHSNENFVKNIPNYENINIRVAKDYVAFDPDLLTPDQKKVIKYYQENTLKVGIYLWDPYYIEKDGNLLGINYYLIFLLKKVFDLKIDITVDSFANIKDKLKSGELNLVPGLFLQEIKNNGALPTSSYFLDMPKIYSTNMNIDKINLEALQNIRLAKRRQNGYFNQPDLDYLKKNNIHLNIFNYDSDEDLIKAIKDGNCDYILGSGSAKYLESGLYPVDFTEFELGKLHYIGVNQNAKDLIPILNQFLNQKLVKNLNTYFADLNKIRLRAGDFFTPDENKLLGRNLSLSVKAVTQGSYPDVFLGEDNKLTGKEIYAFDRISKLLDIEYILNLESSTNKAISDLSNDRINVVLGVSDALNRGGVITPTKSITISPFYVVGYADNISSYSDIFDADIGIIFGQVKDKYLLNMFPTKEFKVFQDQKEASSALRNGEVENLIVSDSFYNYLAYESDYKLKKTFRVDLNYKSVINFSSSYEGRLYASIFSKSLNFLDDFARDPLQSSSSSMFLPWTPKKAPDSTLFKIVSFTIWLLLLLFIYKLLIKLAKEEDQNKQQEYKNLLEFTDVSYWHYDNDLFHGEVIILSDETVEKLSLQRIRLINKNSQSIVKLSALKEFFADKRVLVNLLKVGKNMLAKNYNKDKSQNKFIVSDVLIARDGNKEDLISINISMDRCLKKGNALVFGFIKDLD